MRLVKEAEKMGILAMRLHGVGISENIPVQPVHPVPPGMRLAHAVAAEPCDSPIDFGSTAQDIFSLGYLRLCGTRRCFRKMHLSTDRKDVDM